MYRTPDGTTARGRVALDTQSNMSFSIACVSLAREKRPWETDVVYGVGGKPVSVGETLSFTVMRNGQAVTLDTHEGPPGLLSNGVCALLSCDHMAMLGIDLNTAQADMRHRDIQYLTPKGTRHNKKMMDQVSLMIDIKNKTPRKVACGTVFGLRFYVN